MLENSASEQGSRMSAMDNATRKQVRWLTSLPFSIIEAVKQQLLKN
ncbi:MAG: hypothetical protein CM1200mP13_08020 [Candidatus Pelagibacterales bacterium]|nr:MAG: hypothetical protein CM1200mP13_08020 [Pelagibacterales bacterium]